MYERAYRSGRTFDEFLASAEANERLWRSIADRVQVPAEAAARAAAIPGRWRLLVLAEDWCGDAVNTVPVVACLAEAAGNLEMRVVGREDHAGLMERHLTRGARAIPIVILLDEAHQPRGWWGPRPRRLQAWFEADGRRMDRVDRYRALRKWYARDKGEAVLREVTDLVWCGNHSGGKPYQGTRPCRSLEAA